MPGPALTLPTPGGSTNTWGTSLNAVLNQINDYDLFARKTANQSVTASITKVDDTHLSVSVIATAVYLVQWSLRTDGATTGDLRYAFAGPAGATMTWSSLGLDIAAAAAAAPFDQDVAAIGTDVLHGTLPTTTVSRVEGTGLLITTGTAGTFKMQWAQRVSDATATRLLQDSWMLATRMA